MTTAAVGNWLTRPGIVRLSEEALEASRWAARGLALFALGVFALLMFERGAPRSVLEQSWETSAQYAVLGIVAVGCAVAFQWEGLGGWIMAASSVALGVLASIAYQPAVALFGCLAFFVPAALFLVHWQHHHGRALIVVTAAVMGSLLAGGAVASARIYNYYSGPTHPESAVKLPPVDLAAWAWSGGVTSDGFVVKARIRDVDDGVPDLLVSEVDGRGPLLVVPPSAGPSEETSVVTYVAAGLSPDTEYAYQLRRGENLDDGRKGTVRTFPSGRASFTFAFGSCARTGSNGQVYDRIRESNPVAFIVAGDIHYENISTGQVDRIRTGLTRVLESPAQEALLLSAPIVYTWDDHDFGGDGSDSLSRSRGPAQTVYREFVPHYALPGGETGGAIYQAFTIGRVRFIITDSRSERSPAGATGDPSRTMLGAGQLRWLKDELLAARDSHAFTFWVNGVPWIAPEGDDRDDWGGYAVERREISDFIAANGITNLAMLSGDAHMLAIDDGSNNTFDSAGEGPGFPVFHAAALDRRGKVKGGPYSEGTYPGGGQFGLVTVTDSGSTIQVDWSGQNWKGEVVVAHSFTVNTGGGQ